MLKLCVIAVMSAVCAVASSARAADKPLYAPPGEWVRAVPIPDQASGADGAASQILLQSEQTRFGPQGDEFFQEYATKILTPQGLSDAGNFILPWDPDTDTLTIHRLNIIRDGKVIDQLAGGKNVTILRRETNLEMGMLDGALTATVQPTGLQVGDVVDIAYTTLSHDPVLRDHTVGFAGPYQSGVIGRYYMHVAWPKSKPVRWRATDGMPKPQVAQTAQGAELLIDQANVSVPKAPAKAPYRFKVLGLIEFSQFADWSELSALMAPLYAKAAALAPESSLKAEIQAIAAASSDPEVRAGAALKLVEDKTRYVALSLNGGGYVPADADLTWSRRFGDCKGKTALLLALLQALGVDAEPVLVNTEHGDGMDQRLPELLFDHVIVRAHIKGRDYWLDATRQGDRDLELLTTPYYRWVLPVRATGATLEPLKPGPFADPNFESIVKLDATGGLDVPAPAHVQRVYRGEDGLDMYLNLSNRSRADAERDMKDYWRRKISWVDPKTASFAFDEATHTTTLTMDGLAKIEWSPSGGARDFTAYDSSLGFEANFDREPGLHQDAPYEVAYPSYNKWTVIVRLPNKGIGFDLLNAHEDKTVAGVRYQRESSIDADGVATLTAIDQALAPEFPAAEARTAAAALRQMSQYTGAIRAGGSQVMLTRCLEQTADANIANCSAIIEDKTSKSEDLAAAYGQRGRWRVSRHESDLALKDLDKAITLNPHSVGSLVNRGEAHRSRREFDLAIADYDQALALKSNDTAALVDRGLSRIGKGEFDKAIADFDAALRVSPDLHIARVDRALAYRGGGNVDLAMADLDSVLKQKPDYAWAHFIRGGLRAQTAQFDKALEDFDEAVRLDPNSAENLIARGSLHADRSRFDLALMDFDAALRLQPESSAAYYGRGRAEMGKQDFAAVIRDMDSVDRLTPNQPGPSVMRSIIYRNQGQTDLALKQANQAIRFNPNVPEPYRARSAAYEKLGQWDQAIADADKAAELLRGSPAALNGQCWVRAEAGRDLDRALAFCDAALKLAPSSAAIVDSRGFVHFRKGQLTEAMSDYDAALKLSAKQSSSLFMRGLAKRRLGDTAGGDADIAAAKAMAPKVAEGYAALGVMP